ncbi:MAG: ATP-binding protein [Candidatus Gastranaerophilales bacterium]|nr:ATP-binding protein [Candidatus Gastranaerophilales bacterium]
MKKITGKKNINELLGNIALDSYTKQTIISLFRTLLETIIEANAEAVVIFKIDDSEPFKNILTRLSFSNVKNYTNNDIFNNKFNLINVNDLFEKEEQFLIINADRFSALLYWKENIVGLSDCICTLNPTEVKNFVDYIQENLNDIRIENDMSQLKLDRRGNEKFTTILNKLMTSIENNSRELICANTELENLQNAEDEISDINKLISTLAHEIRNPLSLINTYIEIISKQTENIGNKETTIAKSILNATENIKKASFSLENLLNELIEFNKEIKLELTQINLEDVVLDTINMFEAVCIQKNISIEFDKNNDVKAPIDIQKIHQVLLNLIKNAIEASEKNSKITLKLNADGNFAEIKISDEGSGIDAENTKKIFMPYFTTKQKGTGIGLSFSKKIIESHKGSLNLVSTGKNGTTFSIKLPISREG